MKRSIETNIMNNIKKQNGGAKSNSLSAGIACPDERQKLYNMAALTCGLIAGLVLDIVMIFYYFIKRNIEGTYPYIAQMLVISAAFCIASRRNAEVTLPKTVFGKNLNADNTVSGFFKRLLRYAADSALFTVVLIAFAAYAEGNFSVSFLLDGIISFVVFTLFDILFCEIRVHRYRKYTAKLDEEENDLSD